MTFIKDDKNINRNGRPIGSGNKSKMLLRERISDFLDQNFENIVDDINKLESKDRIKFYMDLLNFGLPRLSSIELPEKSTDLSDDMKRALDKARRTNSCDS
jgi:hypothetical protein